MSIVYTIGDATLPAGPGPKIIVHICNDQGKWGKGFVSAKRTTPYPQGSFPANVAFS